MPKRRINRNSQPRKRRKLNGGGSTNPREGISTYLGPVITANEIQSISTTSGVLHYVTQIVSSGAGAIVTAIDKDPSSVAPEWASWVALFDEYRVLAMEVNYVPRNEYLGSITLMPSVIAAVDHDDATTPPTFASVFSKSSSKICNMAQPWKMTWRMSGNPDNTWSDLNAPATGKGSIKIYNAGTFSNSTTYGDILIRWRVQFRSID